MNTIGSLSYVQQTLINWPGLAGMRIAQGIVPEGTPRPYVAWSVDFAIPQNYIDGEQPDEDNQRIQVNAYSEREAEARTIMAQIVPACEQIGQIQSGPWYAFEEQTKLHRYVIDLSLFTRRQAI